MAPDVLAWVSGADPVWVPPNQTGKVLGLGSNLHHIQENDVVWGTGAIYERPVRLPQRVAVLATRGPLTRRLLGNDTPEIYGDPAILLPLFHPPAPDRQWRVGVVPHFVDRELVDITDPAVRVIDVCMPWRAVVDEITACEVIVSSSLHGVIVAEAYGIPAVWTSLSGNVIGGSLKFDDYYLGTNRDKRQSADWQLGFSRLADLATPPPRLDTEALVDIWNRHMTTSSGDN